MATRVSVGDRVKGWAQQHKEFGRIARDNQRAVREQLKGTKASNLELEAMQDRLKGLADTQVALLKAMQATGNKGGAAYKGLSRDLKGVERDAQRVTSAMRNMRQAVSGGPVTSGQLQGQLAKGAFGQGLAQGAGFGQFLQRGPGVGRQALGIAVGRAARGVGSATLGLPFGGIGSLAQGLQSVPGGGLAAIPLRLAAQQAGTALSFQRQMLQSPGMAGIMSLEATPGMRTKAALAAAKATVSSGTVAAAAASSSGKSGLMARAMDAMVGTMGSGMQGLFDSSPAKSAALAAETRKARKGAFAASMRRQQQAGRRDLAAMGVPLGFSLQESFGIQAAISQAGGGDGRGLLGRDQKGGQGLGAVALAAQREFQVGPDIAGAFLRGGRRGGISGGRGQAGENMLSAIREGLELGLVNSEVTSYLKIVADGISSFETTGIPFNKEALQSFSAGFSNVMGLSGGRGTRVGQSIMSGIQGIGTNGPTGALGLLMLTRLGGLKGLGGMDVLRAREKLSSLDGENIPMETLKIIKEVFDSSGLGGAAAVQGIMGSLNANLSPRDMISMIEFFKSGEPITPDTFRALRQGQTGVDSPAALMEMASKKVARFGSGVVRDVGMSNTKLATGGAMLGVVQDFEKAATSLTKSFTSIVGGPLKDLSSGVLAVGKLLPDLVSALESLVGGGRE